MDLLPARGFGFIDMPTMDLSLRRRLIAEQHVLDRGPLLLGGGVHRDKRLFRDRCRTRLLDKRTVLEGGRGLRGPQDRKEKNQTSRHKCLFHNVFPYRSFELRL